MELGREDDGADLEAHDAQLLASGVKQVVGSVAAQLPGSERLGLELPQTVLDGVDHVGGGRLARYLAGLLAIDELGAVVALARTADGQLGHVALQRLLLGGETLLVAHQRDEVEEAGLAPATRDERHAGEIDPVGARLGVGRTDGDESGVDELVEGGLRHAETDLGQGQLAVADHVQRAVHPSVDGLATLAADPVAEQLHVLLGANPEVQARLVTGDAGDLERTVARALDHARIGTADAADRVVLLTNEELDVGVLEQEADQVQDRPTLSFRAETRTEEPLNLGERQWTVLHDELLRSPKLS